MLNSGRKSPERVYLGLGSNLGNQQDNLKTALRSLYSKARVLKISPVYETRPTGYEDQPDFLNIVCLVSTQLTPEQLLGHVKSIERQMGRKESFRNAPRIIDIDILLWGKKTVDIPSLKVPHPRIAEREFVLRPFADIAPGVIHPGLHKTVKSLLERLQPQGVRKVDIPLKGF